MKSAARSAIIIVGALVLPRGIRGMIAASTTRRPSRPWPLETQAEAALAAAETYTQSVRSPFHFLELA